MFHCSFMAFSILLAFRFRHQALEPPPYDATETRGGYEEQPSLTPLRRRLVGCLFLLLLGLAPCPLVLHAAVFYPLIMRDSVAARVVCAGMYLLFVYVLLRFLVDEARQSPVGMVLRAEVVTVDEVADFIDKRSADVAPEIRFKVCMLVC